MPSGDPWPLIKPATTVILLAALLAWETVAPAMGGPGRWRHALTNLSLALLNIVLLALAFGAAIVAVTAWTHEQRLGLLNLIELPLWLRLPVALVLLDFWLYVWHRTNHAIPLLWRFHRAHHADERLDVTTATRFHPGDLIASSVLRLALVPLLGLEVRDLLIHDALVVAATQFHHADITLGRFDRPLRWLIVTPGMHAVHHSRERRECDSNYGVVLSLWDRLAGTLRTREGPAAYGVPGMRDGGLWGILASPFTSASRTAPAAPRRPPSPARPASARAPGSRPSVPG